MYENLLKMNGWDMKSGITPAEAARNALSVLAESSEALRSMSGEWLPCLNALENATVLASVKGDGKTAQNLMQKWKAVLDQFPDQENPYVLRSRMTLLWINGVLYRSAKRSDRAYSYLQEAMGLVPKLEEAAGRDSIPEEDRLQFKWSVLSVRHQFVLAAFEEHQMQEVLREADRYAEGLKEIWPWVRSVPELGTVACNALSMIAPRVFSAGDGVGARRLYRMMRQIAGIYAKNGGGNEYVLCALYAEVSGILVPVEFDDGLSESLQGILVDCETMLEDDSGYSPEERAYIEFLYARCLNLQASQYMNSDPEEAKRLLADVIRYCSSAIDVMETVEQDPDEVHLVDYGAAVREGYALISAAWTTTGLQAYGSDDNEAAKTAFNQALDAIEQMISMPDTNETAVILQRGMCLSRLAGIEAEEGDLQSACYDVEDARKDLRHASAAIRHPSAAYELAVACLTGCLVYEARRDRNAEVDSAEEGLEALEEASLDPSLDLEPIRKELLRHKNGRRGLFRR